jgi:hypothetical protein
MTAVRIHLIVAMLASLWACRRFGDGECCRQNGVTFRRTEAGAVEAKGTGFLAKDDALTVMAYPGWHKRLARFDSDTLRELSPIMDALDHSLLSHLEPNRNDRHWGLYSSLGRLLTQDPSVEAAALDAKRPIIVKVRPAGRQTVAVFMQIMAIHATQLPPPDLLARVIVPSSNSSRTLAHLKRALVEEKSCIGPPVPDYAAVCEFLRSPFGGGSGFVGFSVGEGAVRVDLVSGQGTHLRDRLPRYLEVLRAAPKVDPGDIQLAAEKMSRIDAAMAIVVPGAQIAPLYQAQALNSMWDYILGRAGGPRIMGQKVELATRGHFLRDYLVSLPEHLELRTVQVALVIQDSIRVIADVDLTDHGANLLAGGFRWQEATKEGISIPATVDVGRVISSVTPIRPLYGDDAGRGTTAEALSWWGFGLLQLLQSPALVLKTVAGTVPADQRQPERLASILGHEMGFEDVSWRISSEGQGTVAHLAARGPDGDLARVRVWLASNRRVKAEACILPDRLPCQWSRCSDEVVLEETRPTPQDASNPCWEEALLDLHRMLTDMTVFSGLSGPLGLDDSLAWYQHAIPLHRDLVCAKKDTAVADAATDIDDALRLFVAQKGELIPEPIERKPFPWPAQPDVP